VSDQAVECYVLHETDKARRIELRETGKQTWVPKSVTKYIQINPIPDEMIGRIPGKPTLIKVEDWFYRKNKEFAEIRNPSGPWESN
jgi:hypothetical protein